mmetsp:Transcript_25540/g.71428  ORF Transcript_25540/g.71428 Transcript_25540/m.71428 type:complete len:213 (-) Transcript_25540:2439-3077(-)
MLAVKAFRILYLSFSSAGWFCRFGRRADNRPVSVLMFREQWMRLSGVEILSPWSGSMKFDSSVSMALISTRASAAAQACSPGTPPPNAAYRSPQPNFLASFSRSLLLPAGATGSVGSAAAGSTPSSAASIPSPPKSSSGMTFGATTSPRLSSSFRAAIDLPASARSAGVPVAGQPDGVKCSGVASGDGCPRPQTPQRVMSRVFFQRAFPSSM